MLTPEAAAAELDRRSNRILEKRRWDSLERSATASGPARHHPLPSERCHELGTRRLVLRRARTTRDRCVLLLPVLGGFGLSLTDFDIYALGDWHNLRFVGLRNYAACSRPAVLERARQYAYFVLVGVPLSIARLARRGAAAALAARALQGPLPHGVLRAGRDDARRRGGGLALPLPPALRAAQRARRCSASRPIDWLGDPHWAMPAIILFAVWKNFGYNMMIFLAGAAGIPEDLYEAARIDGASGWQQFRHITLPMLAPTLLLRRRDHDGRLLPALRRALRDDPGRAAAEHASACCYFMYEEGFRGGTWAPPRRSRSCCSRSCRGHAAAAALARAQESRMKPRWRARWSMARCSLRRLRSAVVPAALDAVGVVHARRRGEHVPAAAAARAADARATTASCSSAPAWAATSLNSVLVATRDDAALAAASIDGRLRVRQAALRAGASACSARCWPRW